MTQQLCIAVICLVPGSSYSAGGQEGGLIEDNTLITTSTRVKKGVYRIQDQAGDGAVMIVGDDLTIDFQGAELIGCRAGQQPDTYSGTGIVIRGRNITLRHASARGYKVGIHATDAPGLVIEDADVSGNFRQHLQSTPQSEEISDWLSPHDNDDHQWMQRYGAGVYIEGSDGITVRRVRARDGQNGIILDRVNRARIYDNDCSFLSGWGLAMWRSSHNVITRNAFDFCVRGYSHGAYNRGQDSAGILMFEQNNHNVIAENSATHGGDGLFGFGGKASLAGAGRTGNNNNLIIGNDFSYAAAHGIEMTFSFDNRFLNNRLVGNAICGVWAGYSQDSTIAGNTLEANGEAGYGREGGGVNIEHGRGNVIVENQFAGNSCGVSLWSDDDVELLKKPWSQAHHRGSTDNVIAQNTFQGDTLGVRLVDTSRTIMRDNLMTAVGTELEADEASAPHAGSGDPRAATPATYSAHGQRRPVGGRAHLRGRAHIVMTEWGPYGFAEPVVTPSHASGADQVTFRVLGTEGSFVVSKLRGRVQVTPDRGRVPGKIEVSTTEPGLHAFELEITINDRQRVARGTLLNTEWTVKFFKWDPSDDPRKHPDRWRALLAGRPLKTITTPAIDFKWRSGRPHEQVPGDHFGTAATTTLALDAGMYKIRTVSDDGIRVWVDQDLVIDDWTWHAPKSNDALVTLEKGHHDIRVEHFEIDGYAWLELSVEAANDPIRE